MTDNTEELDEILELLHNSWLEDDYDTKDPDAIESKQAILDWHNKQVDYVIGENDESDITVLRKYLPEDEARHIRDRNYARNFLRAEQRQRAERNKLKEVK